MTAVAQQVLELFDRLSGSEQEQVAAQILRLLAYFHPPPLSNEDLVFSAEELFLELDRHESTHE
jgi:hypothetical protein